MVLRSRQERNESQFSPLTQSVLLTAFYFIGGMLGRAGSFMAGEVALIWPPAGIAVAALLLFGNRFWPGVAAGSVLFSVVSGKSLGIEMFAAAIGNTVSAIACVYFLENIGFRRNLSQLKDATAFILLAAALGTAINSAFNVVGLCYAHMVAWNDLFPTILNAWVPNALGTLLVAPLMLAWASPCQVPWRNRRLEMAGCIAGLATSCYISFHTWLFHGLTNYPMAFLPFPFLVWASLRFEQRGGATATAVVAVAAIAQLLGHRGPFYTGDETTSVLLIGCYIGVASCLTLLLAGGAMERDEAHRRLAVSERQYRGVVEDQFDLICRFRSDGTLTFVNDAYCRFQNKSRQELVGTNYFEELPVEDRNIPLAVFQALTPQRDHVSFDSRIFLADKILWQQVTVSAVFDEENQIVEFQAVMQDVTARKESEERLTAVLDTMMTGVIVVSPPGYIHSMNPAAEKIFSRKAADVIGQPVDSLFSASDAALFAEHLSRPVRRGETKLIELGALNANGGTLPIELAVTETTVSRLHMQIILVRDISDRKELEMQSQKMESIARLTGGVAHDFRNLTQAILGYAELLLQRMPSQDDNRQTVEQIQKSAEHATSLTTQLLGFSRRRPVERKVISMNETIGDMTRLIGRVVGEMVRVTICLCDEQVYVHADAAQLQQIVLNLAINARDAMAGAGELKIQTNVWDLHCERHGTIGTLKPGSYAVLRVQDNGCGMHPEVQARIFEPFFTTKEKNRGTGLGLSIVRDIVQISGGDVFVESTPGRGSTFLVYLPLAPAPAVESCVEAEARFPLAAGSETILLVEDEELVRSMLTEVLTATGYNVLAAADGMEGLNLSRSHEGEIDLLISDLMLPELPGWQLADRIAKSRGPIPVLFMSGYTSEEIAQKTRGRHGNDFLQKPFNNEALLMKARQILDQRKCDLVVA